MWEGVLKLDFNDFSDLAKTTFSTERSSPKSSVGRKGPHFMLPCVFVKTIALMFVKRKNSRVGAGENRENVEYPKMSLSLFYHHKSVDFQ